MCSTCPLSPSAFHLELRTKKEQKHQARPSFLPVSFFVCSRWNVAPSLRIFYFDSSWASARLLVSFASVLYAPYSRYVHRHGRPLRRERGKASVQKAVNLWILDFCLAERKRDREGGKNVVTYWSLGHVYSFGLDWEDNIELRDTGNTYVHMPSIQLCSYQLS